VVDKESSSIGIGDSIGINENHIFVNKPFNKSDLSYSAFVNFILKVLQ